jgi:hypothetical protein
MLSRENFKGLTRPNTASTGRGYRPAGLAGPREVLCHNDLVALPIRPAGYANRWVLTSKESLGYGEKRSSR